MSTSHDIATSAYRTITVRSLRNILPAHYCDNTVKNLQADLTDLQCHYETQSRKLTDVRAAPLIAEIERRKRSVASKTDELAAVRRELDRLPDPSRELVLARNELRWSNAQMHSTCQQYNNQLSEITSIVANSQPDSPMIPQYITNSDASAEKAIICALEELDAAVQRTAVSISTCFIRHMEAPNADEQSSATRRVSNSVPVHQSFIHHIQTMSPHALSWYLPIALRGYLTSYVNSIISSWARDKETDGFIKNTYDRVRKSESQVFAAGWRSLTSSNFTDNYDALIPHIMQGLSDIIVAAGCAASASDTQAKMSPKFWHDISSIISAAEKLRDSIGGAPASDFKAILIHYGQTFDRNTMVVDHRTGLEVRARGKVLCTTCLGLIKEVGAELPHAGKNDALTVSTVIKPTVVLQENK